MSHDVFLSGLMQATAQRDEQAFAELYRLTSGRLNAIVLRVLGNAAAANEVLQETYVRIWNRAETFDAARGDVLAWMVTIARHIAIDFLRRHGRGSVPLDEIGEVADLSVGSPDLGLDVVTCLKTLESTQARAITLAFFHGYSHSELADRLGSPIGTVKSWVRRGLTKLKECLEGHDQRD